LARSRAFYSKLGFEFVVGPVGPEPVAIMKHPAGVEVNFILNANVAEAPNVLMDVAVSTSAQCGPSQTCTVCQAASDSESSASGPRVSLTNYASFTHNLVTLSSITSCLPGQARGHHSCGARGDQCRRHGGGTQGRRHSAVGWPQRVPEGCPWLLYPRSRPQHDRVLPARPKVIENPDSHCATVSSTPRIESPYDNSERHSGEAVCSTDIANAARPDAYTEG